MKVNDSSLKVSCYSGHTYAESPRSFELEGEAYEVAVIEKAWQEPEEKHFQVRTRENKLFKLCYNETQKQWSITELVRSRQ